MYLALVRVHRDLRPDQQPLAVGQLVDVGVHRIVGPQHRRAELLGPAHQPSPPRVVDREALRAVVLVHADAADLHRPAVERQAAHRRPGSSARRCARASGRAAARPRRRRSTPDTGTARPATTASDSRSLSEPSKVAVSPAPDRPGAEPDAARAEAPGDGHAPAAARDVAQPRRHPHGRRAGAAAEPRDHERRLELDPVDPLEIDLAQDPAVVPPAAGRQPGGRVVAGGREVRQLAARVHAHHEPVHAAAVEPFEQDA